MCKKRGVFKGLIEPLSLHSATSVFGPRPRPSRAPSIATTLLTSYSWALAFVLTWRGIQFSYSHSGNRKCEKSYPPPHFLFQPPYKSNEERSRKPSEDKMRKIDVPNLLFCCRQLANWRHLGERRTKKQLAVKRQRKRISSRRMVGFSAAAGQKGPCRVPSSTGPSSYLPSFVFVRACLSEMLWPVPSSSSSSL